MVGEKMSVYRVPSSETRLHLEVLAVGGDERIIAFAIMENSISG